MSRVATIQKILSKTARNGYDRRWWREVAFPHAARTIHSHLPHQGINLSNEEWDNLIILDACRYDMFAELSELPGQLTKRTSAGANTPEFLQANFQDGDFRDTVYVTANPQVNVHLSDEFFNVINVWEEHWDEDHHTVLPEAMAEETIEAYEAYPNKRVIAHFIQPHYPFLGEIGQEKLNPHSGMELSKRLANDEVAHRDRKSVWEQLEEGSISVETTWEAYRENLEITLPHVERLIETFDEHTVVTSDHGNALGERAWPVPVPIYGHPPVFRMPALTDVPWLVTNRGTRKEITTGESTDANVVQHGTVKQRLSDLGYK